jgi:hypothetical protein
VLRGLRRIHLGDYLRCQECGNRSGVGGDQRLMSSQLEQLFWRSLQLPPDDCPESDADLEADMKGTCQIHTGVAASYKHVAACCSFKSLFTSFARAPAFFLLPCVRTRLESALPTHWPRLQASLHAPLLWLDAPEMTHRLLHVDSGVPAHSVTCQVGMACRRYRICFVYGSCLPTNTRIKL